MNIKQLAIFICFICLNILESQAQEGLKMEMIDGQSFVSISTSNLQILYHYTQDELEKTALNSGFVKLDEKNGLVTYIIGKMGSRWQTLMKSKTHEFSAIGWYDVKGKYYLTSNLRKELANTPFITQGKNNYYNIDIEGKKYKIGIPPKSEFIFVEASIGVNKETRSSETLFPDKIVENGELIVIDYSDSMDYNNGPRLMAEVMPEFVGGTDSLLAFLGRNIKYPDWEKKNKIQGIVYAGFIIDINGKITEPKILRTVDESKNFDAEVLRVINMMPNWVPAEHNNQKVAIQYRLPIKFIPSK